MNRFTRRDALRGAALGAAALGLSGCGMNRFNPSEAEAEQPISAKVDGDLYYFNYSEYMDPGLIKGFEKRYGVRVIESNFDSMQGMLAKLNAGNRYDVIFPTAEWVDKLHQGQPAAADRSLAAAQLPAGHELHGLLQRPLVRPRVGAHGALRASTRPGSAGGRTSSATTDRLLEGPLERGGQGQDLRARRLPGGARHGEPPQRLRPEHGRRGGARARPSRRSSARSRCCAATRRTRSRRCRAATPGSSTCGTATSSTCATRSTTRELQVREVQGGHPGRLATRSRSRPTREHPGTALLFIDCSSIPSTPRRTSSTAATRCPTTAATRRSPSSPRTSPSINVTVEQLEEGDQFAQPRRARTGRLERHLDGGEGRVGGDRAMREGRCWSTFLMPGRHLAGALLRGSARHHARDLLRDHRRSRQRRSTRWNPENYARVFDPLFAAGADPLGRLRARRPPPLCLRDRLPGRLLHRPLRRPLQAPADRSSVVLPFLVNYLVRIYAWVAILSDEGLVNGLLGDAGLTETASASLNTPYAVIGGLVVRLHGVHDPAGLRGARPHGPVADRGRQGPLRHAARQTFRNVTLAGHLPGRPGRAASSSSCRRSATSSAPSCSAARTPTWSGT